MKPKHYRRALRALALLAGVARAALCLRALTDLESYGDQQARALLFVIAFGCASFGWQPRPPWTGGRRKERLRSGAETEAFFVHRLSTSSR